MRVRERDIGAVDQCSTGAVPDYLILFGLGGAFVARLSASE